MGGWEMNEQSLFTIQPSPLWSPKPSHGSSLRLCLQKGLTLYSLYLQPLEITILILISTACLIRAPRMNRVIFNSLTRTYLYHLAECLPCSAMSSMCKTFPHFSGWIIFHYLLITCFVFPFISWLMLSWVYANSSVPIGKIDKRTPKCPLVFYHYT